MKFPLTITLLVSSVLWAVASEALEQVDTCEKIYFDISEFSIAKAKAEDDIEKLIQVIEELNTTKFLGRTFALVRNIEEKIRSSNNYPKLKKSWAQLNTKEIYEIVSRKLKYQFQEDTELWIIEYCHPDPVVVREFLDVYGESYIEYYAEIAEANDWRVKEMHKADRTLGIFGEPPAGGNATR
ncbi:MAG: hypothetical protein AB3N10_18440 [Allomuricauda sp.]